MAPHKKTRRQGSHLAPHVRSPAVVHHPGGLPVGAAPGRLRGLAPRAALLRAFARHRMTCK